MNGTPSGFGAEVRQNLKVDLLTTTYIWSSYLTDPMLQLNLVHMESDSEDEELDSDTDTLKANMEVLHACGTDCYGTLLVPSHELNFRIRSNFAKHRLIG